MARVIEAESVKNVKRAERALKAAHKTYVLASRAGDAGAVREATAARSAARAAFITAERANKWAGDGIGAFTRPLYFGGAVAGDED